MPQVLDKKEEISLSPSQKIYLPKQLVSIYNKYRLEIVLLIAIIMLFDILLK